MICVTWKDKKTVHLLSTLPEGLDIGEVERRLRSDGQWQTKNFTQPKLIKLYNSNKGGVYLVINESPHAPGLLREIFIIFFHMLEVAVLNVHIMYRGAGHSARCHPQRLWSSLLEEIAFVETTWSGMLFYMWQIFVSTTSSSIIL